MITFDSAAITELRVMIACGCNILAANGHDDFVWGHVSARDPDGRGIWMKASGYGLEEVTPEHVVLVSFEGEVLEGTASRHNEWPIHTEILAARRDINAVVHTHPPYAMALGVSGKRLLALSQAASLFVPPDVPRFTKTALQVHTPAQAVDVAAELGEQHALLMVNHGVVTTGLDVRAAVVRAVLFEKAAYQQCLAYLFGEPAKWMDDAESLAKREMAWPERYLVQLWDYLSRRLVATQFSPGLTRS